MNARELSNKNKITTGSAKMKMYVNYHVILQTIMRLFYIKIENQTTFQDIYISIPCVINLIDHLINYMTLHVFQFKKYRCINCNWNGRKWEESFKG